MSAPMAGRRPSRFTFNIPSPTHKQQSPQLHPVHLKYPQHPPAPASFLARKKPDHITTTAPARRRKAGTPHPITIHKAGGFVDYSLSLQFSPSFSPSSCVISGISLPDTPTSVTDSPVSDMRQRRWSVEMRRDCDDESEEQEEEEEEEEGEERNIMSPNILSSSSCSFLSPLTSSSSLDTPMSSSPASPHSPAECKAASHHRVPPAQILSPHRRLHSDPLPISTTSSVSSVAFKLNLRPLVIPPSKDEAIILITALSPMPLSQLTDRQQSYEEGAEQPSAAAGVDALLHGRPMTLSECWYGRSELMSPVSGASMMYMAAQQKKTHQLPFANLCRTTAAC